MKKIRLIAFLTLLSFSFGLSCMESDNKKRRTEQEAQNLGAFGQLPDEMILTIALNLIDNNADDEEAALKNLVNLGKTSTYFNQLLLKANVDPNDNRPQKPIILANLTVDDLKRVDIHALRKKIKTLLQETNKIKEEKQKAKKHISFGDSNVYDQDDNIDNMIWASRLGLTAWLEQNVNKFQKEDLSEALWWSLSAGTKDTDKKIEVAKILLKFGANINHVRDKSILNRLMRQQKNSNKIMDDKIIEFLLSQENLIMDEDSKFIIKDNNNLKDKFIKAYKKLGKEIPDWLSK